MQYNYIKKVSLIFLMVFAIVAGYPQSKSMAEENPTNDSTALDQALKELNIPQKQTKRTTQGYGKTKTNKQRLLDISMNALFAVGGSTENDESLQNLQGGGHDPRKRGFTVQNVEVSFMGAVDHYFTGEMHLIYFLDPLEGESVFELEEAFVTTLSMPAGLQLEMGQFFTEFGRLNPTHPHSWNWQDQPIINTRLFGPDGMRGPGFRVGWLTPLPWFSEFHFGTQNANGETMASFLANGEFFGKPANEETMASFLASDEFFGKRAIGKRPFKEHEVGNTNDLVYLARWVNSWDFTNNVIGKIGFSGLLGPNATGDDGKTNIYGGDFVVKWRPSNNDRGWPFLIWESEFMKRDYEADKFYDGSDSENIVDLQKETLEDWGLYTQLLYGFRKGWATGLRFDYAAGKKESVGGRDKDPFRDNRQRISPLLIWYPSEYSRFRLQYNFDKTEHLEDKEAHSVWMGIEFLFGSHPAHKF